VKARLSDKMVETFRHPAGVKQLELWDTVMNDLFLRVSAGGTKTWMVRMYVTGKRRRVSIGTWPAMPVAVARDAARKTAIDSSVAETAEVSSSFGALCRSFEEIALPTLAASTQREWRRIIDGEIVPVIGKSDTSAYKAFRAEIREMLDRIAARSTYSRNKTLVVVRRIYNWAAGRDMVEPAPVFAGMEALAEPPRERLLTDTEVQAILTAGGRDRMEWRAFWPMLVYTGMRRGTVLRSEWSWVDEKERALLVPSGAVKGKAGQIRATAVPLVETLWRALQLQREATGMFQHVFANPSTGEMRFTPQKAVERVQAWCGVDDWHVHDFRLWVGTTLSKLGIQPNVKDAILMHRTGTPLSRRYDLWGLFPEKRSALQRLEAHLNAGLDPKANLALHPKAHGSHAPRRRK